MNSVNEISITHADPTQLEDCSLVIVEAFKSEKISNYVFNFSHPDAKKFYHRQMTRHIKHYMGEGNHILVALKDSRVVGIATLHKKTKRPLLSTVRSFFVTILDFIPLIPKVNWKRVLSMGKAFTLTQKIKDDYYILHLLAVHPEYQGQSIGKTLLEKVHSITDNDLYSSGIYLYTGNKKNHLLYEAAGYETIQAEEGADLAIYHMFRPINKS